MIDPEGILDTAGNARRSLPGQGELGHPFDGVEDRLPNTQTAYNLPRIRTQKFPWPWTQPLLQPARRILLLEDHEPTWAPLVRLLARRGYEMVSADTDASALNEAAKNHFDLVLSDIGLPDRNGFELMRELRDLYGNRGIALTGYGMKEDVVRSGKSGFVAHLTKPISVAVLDRALTPSPST